MTHRSRLLAAVFGAALSVPVAGFAQDTRGVQALLDQANYWRLQNRPELVVRTLERVLAVDPRNADALAGAALAQAQSGNRPAAEGYLARLRQVAPNDPRVAETDINVRAATVDQGALAEARRLAQAGRTAEAIARYRELFRGNQPPDAYAVEFYQTLAGTEAGFPEAQAGLSRLSGRFPQDQRLQLALAQTLTFRDQTRGDGINRLRRLSQNPEVANTAVAAWRQALIWQGNNPAVIPDMEAFLQRFPNDTVITQRLEEVRNAPAGRADPAAEGRIRAFEALNAGRLGESRRDFEAAIASNPNDSDALGGLGVVRLREGRFGEARTLLERAIAANPDSRAQWQQALSGASYAADLATARGALARGDLNTAESALRRAIGSNAADRADAEALLGDLALRRGDLAGAESRYRAALARRPNLGSAASGLFEVLNQQGRFAEAEALRARIGSIGGGGNPNEQRANALRAEAQRTNDATQSAALLAEAIRIDPSNPWARLDLARMYARMGRGAEGRQIVEGSGVSSPDQLFAAALYANEDNRPEDVQRYLAGIPVRLRTADMNRLLSSSRTDAEARQAINLYRGGRRQEGRAMLVALAARPDPSGATAGSAIRALGLVNDRAGAAEAGRAYVGANPNSGAQARLNVAGALLSAGATAEATALSRSVEGARGLTPEDQRQAAALSTGLAIQSADRLNERGQQAAAFDVLAPALQRDPGSVPANLALARLYQGAGQPTQARQISEGILQRDPRSLDARVGAIEAAVASRDFGRAEALLVEARALNPNDPRVSLLEARIARASGNSGRALRALELAAEQRRAQGIVADAPGTGIGAETSSAFDNPFRRVSRAGALGGSSLVQTDPLSGEIARELSQVREETASRLQGGIGFRSRTGTGGLDRLEEYSAPLDFSTGVPGAGGRATFSVSPVAITSGRLDASNTALLRSYGSNALATELRTSSNQNTQLTQVIRDRFAPRDTSVQGVGLGLGYTRGAFAADIGTSPIGFRRQNILGGVEIAPALSNNFRVRLIGEQRSVTDSLLSWSGVRDPRTGQSWGGVVRSGGRLQLEYVTGPVGVYMLGGYSAYTGQNVARNNRFEAGAGMQYTVWRLPDEELTAGLDLVYFGFDNNQRLFTLGNGGYFSPQSYFAVNVPVDWRARSGNLSWRLGGTIGYQSFRENAANFFPRDGALQAQLEQQIATDTTARSIQPARSESGVIGGIRADIEYAVTPNLRIGGLIRYERTANFEEVRGLAFARYRFDR